MAFQFLFQSKGYLIKWKGYSKWHCTLEPKRHLNEACLQEIKHPSKPLPRRLEATSEEVLYTVQKKLSNCHHSSGLVKVNVDLDIFRWILNGKGKRLEKGWILCYESDFSKLNLPLNWHIRRTKLENVAVDFPVRVKASLTRQKACKRFPCGFPVESLQMFFVTKVAAS
ncbi:hypothetical protein MRX96_022206 [Rhipicephalus microplus]